MGTVTSLGVFLPLPDLLTHRGPAGERANASSSTSASAFQRGKVPARVTAPGLLGVLRHFFASGSLTTAPPAPAAVGPIGGKGRGRAAAPQLVHRAPSYPCTPTPDTSHPQGPPERSALRFRPRKPSRAGDPSCACLPGASARLCPQLPSLLRITEARLGQPRQGHGLGLRKPGLRTDAYLQRERGRPVAHVAADDVALYGEHPALLLHAGPGRGGAGPRRGHGLRR